MFITALCPTYRHPKLLANSLALWNAQDYPADQRELLILDDAPSFDEQHGPNWQLEAWQRFPSLPAKYNYLVRLALTAFPQTDAFVVWEDDDIYLPSYISSHAKQLEQHELSKPGIILTDYPAPGTLQAETAGPRFHSSLAFRRELLERVGGWPKTRRADFDLAFIANLMAAAQSIGDPAPSIETCQYIMGWHTGAAHGQFTHQQGPGDEQWYDRCPEVYQPVDFVGPLVAQYDDRTTRLIQAKESKQWVDLTAR